MAKQTPSERFNAAVTALLERRDSFVPQAGADLAPLVSLAIDLRDLPRESFRAKLKTELERSTTMGSNPTPAPETNAKAGAPQVHWKREGFRTVTPYIVVDGAAKLMDFVRTVFGATERLRVPRPDGKIMHAEAQIGDSIIEMADGNAQYPSRPMPIHLYVRDADAAYGRALAAGATSLFRTGGSGVWRSHVRCARSARKLLVHRLAARRRADPDGLARFDAVRTRGRCAGIDRFYEERVRRRGKDQGRGSERPRSPTQRCKSAMRWSS